MVSRKSKVLHGADTIEINAGRATATLKVTNTGDRPVQIGSHFHFFEVNPAMRFLREQAWGMHLDIAAGTGVRFEPGETKQVNLVAYGGARHLVGFNGLVNGGLDAPQTKVDAMRRLADRGFQNGEPDSKVGKAPEPAKSSSQNTKGSK